MNATEQDQWLAEHIPHRVRACLALSALQDELMPQSTDEETRIRTKAGFQIMAAFEGRMAAMRWFIELVGIRDYKGKPDRPRQFPTAVSIESIQGEDQRIDLFSDEAKFLAQVWKGCSQASGHPTRGTNHPTVDNPTLDKALRIIVEHLKRTVYSSRTRDLIAETFKV
jgi:hypothetical protein